jgi:hypothetical protein
MRGRAGVLALLILANADTAAAQLWPRGPVRFPGELDRLRISISAGQQATRTSFAEEQRFDQYFEQGSFTFERTVDRAIFYDASVAVRLWRQLHAGAALSMFEDKGAGGVTAEVPHPLFFDKKRSISGEVSNVTRREVGQHFSAGWAIPDVDGLDLIVFAGPSIFTTEQLFVTALTMSLDKETYPFDSLAFPGTLTEKHRENILGYNVGMDMMWRFTRQIGAGVLIRYANGKKDFTPIDGASVAIEVGGLHIGGGLRLVF